VPTLLRKCVPETAISGLGNAIWEAGGVSAGARYELEQVWSPSSEDLLTWTTDFHDLMLGDELRMRAYRRAIAEAVRPGDVVVDLGTGTGVLARWALEAGAARVYGIERDGDLLERAAAEARDAGWGDRFVPVAGLSFDVELPERAGLVVSEILGNLVDNEDCARILDDAAERFLAPGGRVLPRRAERYLVPVVARRAHAEVGGRAAQADRPFDAYYDVVLPRTGHLSSPRMERAFELGGDRTGPTAPAPTDYRSDRVFAVRRSGLLTGFKGWFVADLSATVALDISGDGIDGPQRTASDSWKHAFLPIERPIAVEPHDRIALGLSRTTPTPSAGAPAFAQSYRWEGAVHRADDVVGRFAQSSRLGRRS
jgi:protein arginine N-methyltransferase 1